jgi:hypothetical protein
MEPFSVVERLQRYQLVAQLIATVRNASWLLL